MSIWTTYENRITAGGATKRETAFNRECRFLNQNLRDSLSYKKVLIDGESKEVSIIDSDNLNEKKMLSLPLEDIKCGAMVEWEENFWIVTEKDANNELYTRTKLLQCNHLLKWVDENDVIREQWCFIEDGTKLERISAMRNSLVCRKRHIKSIPLIAGTPLEPYHQNGAAKSCKRQRSENGKDWAISSQAPNRRRFNDYPESGSRSKCFEMGNPKPHMRHGEDIVCALRKRKGEDILTTYLEHIRPYRRIRRPPLYYVSGRLPYCNDNCKE